MTNRKRQEHRGQSEKETEMKKKKKKLGPIQTQRQAQGLGDKDWGRHGAETLRGDDSRGGEMPLGYDGGPQGVLAHVLAPG